MSGSINEAEGTRPMRVPSVALTRPVGSHWLGPLLVALVTLLALALTLDGVGDSDSPRDGPGLTLDEVFNIEAGVSLAQALLREGPAWFTPAGAARVFGHPGYNPDHPLLGRVWLGVWHELYRPVVSALRDRPPPAVYQSTAARVGSAVAFVLTLILVGGYTTKWYGPAAGTIATLALALTPRAFAHAHLAALETILGLLFTGTVLYVAHASGGRQPPGTPPATTGAPHALITGASPRWRTVCLAGVLFGLTLLTKIQAVLLPLPIAVWWLWRSGRRVLPRVLVFGLVGLAVFLVGWPWLWLDPLHHLRDYFVGKAQRPTLYCYYLGTRYADVDVPWHYPFVMFLVTVPIGLHLLGFWGCVRSFGRPTELTGGLAPEQSAGRRDPRAILVAGVVLFVLTFFALPGITVYDGERLFLVVFPLWGVLVGKGAAELLACSTMQNVTPESPGAPPSRSRRTRRGAAAALLCAGLGEGLWATIQLHPCQLSYYSLAVGGLRGADRFGFEPTYWRDSISRQLLVETVAAVPKGETVYLAPVLHPANQIDLEILSPLIRERQLRLESYDDRDPRKQGRMRYVLVFRRHADPWPSLEPAPAEGRLLAEVSRQGVQLAALYDLQPPAPVASE